MLAIRNRHGMDQFSDPGIRSVGHGLNHPRDGVPQWTNMFLFGWKRFQFGA